MPCQSCNKSLTLSDPHIPTKLNGVVVWFCTQACFSRWISGLIPRS